MEDINKDKLRVRVSRVFSLEEEEKEGERKYIYFCFFFFCQEPMERKGVGYSWMSDQGMVRNERLHLSRSHWTDSRRPSLKETEIFIKKINLR